MKKAELGDYFEWDGTLVKVIGIAHGKMVIFEEVNGQKCECCGLKNVGHVMEDSPIFQENAQPLKTIQE